MGGKLDSKWDGLYTVEEKLRKGRYKLMSKQGVILKKLYSSCLLKEYFELGKGPIKKMNLANCFKFS